MITLRQVLRDYMGSRANLKPSTINEYRSKINLLLADWLDMPIAELTRDQIEERHKLITRENGPGQANLTFRILRALLNYASFKYELANGDPVLKLNPVRRLSEVRAWNKIKRRRGIIEPHQMPNWFNGVAELNNKTVADYLIMLILSGLRRGEGVDLKWDDINFKAKTFVARDTKNGEDHELPMSDFLYGMLRDRFEQRRAGSLFVFPGKIAGAPLSKCFKSFDRMFASCGFRFCLHDLRRTFLTTAHSLTQSQYTLKRLANHKIQNDVTGLYIIESSDDLRPIMQAITDKILLQAGLKEERRMLN